MTTPLRGISSMATRQVLAELVQGWTARGGEPVAIESIGGVDAARRVQSGEEGATCDPSLNSYDCGGLLLCDSATMKCVQQVDMVCPR